MLELVGAAADRARTPLVFAGWHRSCRLCLWAKSPTLEEQFMKDSTHDKAEGKWDETKGKVKEEAGKLGGDRSMEIGGKLDQVKGKGKQVIGEVKEDAEDVNR